MTTYVSGVPQGAQIDSSVQSGPTAVPAGPERLRRDESRDGLRNSLETFALTHFGKLWRAVQSIPWADRKLNGLLVDNAIGKTKPRPYPLSTMSPYTSWSSLTDRSWSGRHLPPDPAFQEGLPPLDKVLKLFERRPGRTRVSEKSTVLFSYFAQWFTDGFLRTDPKDVRKNTSNHDIDLSPLYGRTSLYTKFLRRFEGGKLKSQEINGEEYPLFYYDSSGRVRPEFKESGGDELPILLPRFPLSEGQKSHLFAMGTERANVSIGYVMFNTLFLREHNRICDVLSRSHPSWDDERLFQTARNIVIVLLIKIVVEEYINHIAPYQFKFKFNAPVSGARPWYRQNWMTVEFNLLYRWHSLVRDEIVLGAEVLPAQQTLYNNVLITDRGLGPLFEAASRQPAGEISLFNTARFLLDVDRASLNVGRATQLASYNAYREAVGFPRVTRFEQISSDPEIVNGLREVYGDVDRIEFYVGLFSEDVRPNSALSSMIGRLVGIDAFSQALTNPLLSADIYNEKTFSADGLQIIAATRSLSDVLHRNIPANGNRYLVSFTRGAG